MISHCKTDIYCESKWHIYRHSKMTKYTWFSTWLSRGEAMYFNGSFSKTCTYVKSQWKMKN